MTENAKSADHRTGIPASPEVKAARGALGGLRQDLFHDAFAYRPLPPLGMTGQAARHVPRRLRPFAAWTPHILVGLAALVSLLVGVSVNGNGLVVLLLPIAVGLTLLRPVMGWWLSFAMIALVGWTTPSYNGGSGWAGATLFAHVVVMTVVAARTRPRAAMWMWTLTAAISATGTAFVGYNDVGGPVMVVSALLLLTVTLVQVRRSARQQVAAQQTVTAVERDRRTLLEERTTIARELHDVVAHHMSVVAIQAEAAPYRVENPPPELEQAFATIRENAVAALTELRRVLGVVRAEDYQAPDAPQPTLADLDVLLGNVREAGLSVDKTVTGAVRELPQGVELSAYRIVQEALSNTLRHAPGSTALVEVGYVLGGLGLRIVNTAPRGLAKPSPGAGHGLTGMRERVTMLNGEMTAGGTEEGGYEVAAFIPVPATAAAEPEDTAA